MKNIKIIIVIIVITVIFSGAGAARAESLALSVSPSLLEVMIKPGKSITQLYKLTNNAEDVTVTLKLWPLNENGTAEDTNFTREKWISIVSNDLDFDKPFILRQNKQAEFLLKISPPEDTADKDYYRALVFSTAPNLSSDTTMTSFAQNLATPLLVTVTKSGILEKNAQTVKFDLPKVIDSFDTLETDIHLKNTGTSYFRPIGRISLTGPIGLANIDILPEVIMSGQTRRLMTEKQPPANSSQKTLSLPGFYLGKYTVSLNLALDDGNKTVKEAKTFYAIPWKGLLVFLLAGLVLIKSLKGFRSLRKKSGQ